jgi:linoleoyl-CoA desaturase
LRDKHIYIEQDSQLLKLIYQQIEGLINANKTNFILTLSVKFFVYFTFSALTYSLIFWIKNPFYFIMVFVLYGFSAILFAFNFSHDFAHNTVFKNKKLNNLCFVIIYAMLGAHAEAWKKRHINAHHYAPNVAGYDPDLKITKLIRVIPTSKYEWFHKYQHIYAPFLYTTYTLFWVFIKDFLILFSKDEYSDKKKFLYHLSFWAQKVLYLFFILGLPLLFSYQNWYIVLLGFFLMHATQSLFIIFTFFMTHHVEKTEYPTADKKGYINSSWLMNQVKSSNDMHPFSKMANFILGGFNNHIAHHLFPHVHHIYYPQINKVVYSILKKNHIEPNHTSYWGGVISHIRLLKRLSYR